MKVTMIAASLLYVWGAAAQAPHENVPTSFERLLLPLTVTDTPGAFGTRWSTELWLRFPITSVFAAPLLSPTACDPPCSDVLVISEGESFQSDFYRTHPGETGGQYFYVDKQRADDVSVSLRLAELTGKTGFVPLQLPVVRQHEFRKGTVDLLGLPVREQSRLMLRLYGSDPSVTGVVQVKVISEDVPGAQNVLAERLLSLDVVQKATTVAGISFQLRPPTSQLDLTGLIPPSTKLVRLELRPLSPDLAIWGFVSITDNLTQTVILRTP